MVPLAVCIAWSAGTSQADAPTLPGWAGRSQDPQLHAITGADTPRLASSGTRAQGLDDPGLDGRLKEPQLLGPARRRGTQGDATGLEGLDSACLLFTSDAADDRITVDSGGRCDNLKKIHYIVHACLTLHHQPLSRTYVFIS